MMDVGGGIFVFLITALVMGVEMSVTMRSREAVMEALVTPGSAAEAMTRLMIASTHETGNSSPLTP